MTTQSLSAGQRRTLQIVESLGFGRIERLSIREGEPCYEPPPRLVEEIKLGARGCERNSTPGDFTVKKEFEDLFTQLSRLHDAVVDIEIRHSLPFRLILDRCDKEFQS